MNQNIENNNKLVIVEEKIQKSNGETVVKKYLKGKLLGKGGFAKCYEFTSIESKKILAAKIIPKQTLTKSRARSKLISEIKIHKSLSHQYIVLFEHVFEDNENVYILLELCINNTLNELIKCRKRLTELEVQCYVVQIITALKYLHSQKVIHRDLKLGNLFLNEKMEIKLGDFGLATKIAYDGEKKNTICGTPNYIAPEILEGKQGHSYEVDIWSLGVIIYTLIIGKPPYETPDVKTTYKKIKQNLYTFPDSVPISDGAKNLITKILNLDPTQRPTLDEIMLHPFINVLGTIPKVLPISTLTCPPSASYTKQFLPYGNSLKINQQPVRLIENNQQVIKVKTLSSTNIGKPLEIKNDIQQSTTTKDEQKKFSSQQGGLGIKPATTTNKNSNVNNNGENNFFKSNNTQSANMFVQPKNQFSNNKQFYVFGSENFQPVWVTQWVDYSDKYGLGYILSNGNTGVYFNDSSKIIYDPNTNNVEYLEKMNNQQYDNQQQFKLEESPAELKKKITLLQLFRNYLKEQVLKNNTSQESINTNQANICVYIKKWMKTKHAIMFRLSNKIVQVCFTDKTEILLSSENKLVTYLDKKGNRQNYPLSTALDNQNTEMSKRLKYTKDILTSMLNNNKNKNKKKSVNEDEEQDDME